MGLIGAQNVVIADSHPLEPGKVAPEVQENLVTPTYFDTLRIPIKRGRAFNENDNENAPNVAIVNETMARKFWPNEDALGQRFKSKDAKHQWAEFEVVGIAQDGKYKGVVEDPLPYFYKPLAQEYMPLRNIQVRTSLPPEALELQVASVIQELAPGVAVSVKTMEQDLQGLNGYLFFKLGAQLTGALGILGLTLAMVGVYSVVSYAAAQRTHEIGIRMALGAGPTDVLRMVMSRSLVTIATGVAIGTVIALVGAKALAGFLVGVSPSDPLTFVGVLALLLAVGLAACLVPAYRATRVDPLVALRYE
jgi:putative ABC transport system permease protein